MSYRSCLFLLSLSLSLFFFHLSVAANKRTHRPVSTTCAAHCRCCAFTRQARHCVLWGWGGWVGEWVSGGVGGYCARCEKGSPAVPAPASLVPILNRAIVFLSPCEPSRAQRARRCEGTYMITHTHFHTHTHTHTALPTEAASVRTLLRLQHKRWVQVKPNVCQMLR